MPSEPFILQLAEGPPPQLEGKTFQAHVLPGNRVRLYEVKIMSLRRCPVIIHGERCGLDAGHECKHMWAGGD